MKVFDCGPMLGRLNDKLPVNGPTFRVQGHPRSRRQDISHVEQYHRRGHSTIAQSRHHV